MLEVRPLGETHVFPTKLSLSNTLVNVTALYLLLRVLRLKRSVLHHLTMPYHHADNIMRNSIATHSYVHLLAAAQNS